MRALLCDDQTIGVEEPIVYYDALPLPDVGERETRCLAKADANWDVVDNDGFSTGRTQGQESDDEDHDVAMFHRLIFPFVVLAFYFPLCRLRPPPAGLGRARENSFVALTYSFGKFCRAWQQIWKSQNLEASRGHADVGCKPTTVQSCCFACNRAQLPGC